MTVLRPMEQPEYNAWFAEVVPGYAADKVASGQWSQEESLERSRQEYQELLPQGLETVDNHLLTILDLQGKAVGALWFTVKTKFSSRIAYVFDVTVWPQHQREGHAFRAFLALENEVRRLGLSGIALHVFGHNSAAQALYAKLGFRPTNINLFKPVGPADA